MGRNAYRVLVGKIEGKRLHGGTSSRWECNIEIGFKERIRENFDWFHVTQNSG